MEFAVGVFDALESDTPTPSLAEGRSWQRDQAVGRWLWLWLWQPRSAVALMADIRRRQTVVRLADRLAPIQPGAGGGGTTPPRRKRHSSGRDFKDCARSKEELCLWECDADPERAEIGMMGKKGRRYLPMTSKR